MLLANLKSFASSIVAYKALDCLRTDVANEVARKLIGNLGKKRNFRIIHEHLEKIEIRDFREKKNFFNGFGCIMFFLYHYLLLLW